MHMTKFTHVREWPLLESALFVLMSYAAFLIAEVCELTGVYDTTSINKSVTFITVNNTSKFCSNIVFRAEQDPPCIA